MEEKENKTGIFMHPQTFLFRAIVNSTDSQHKSLGQLEARFVSDIAEVMKDYSEQLIEAVLQSINNGSTVEIRGKYYAAKKQKKKPVDIINPNT